MLNFYEQCIHQAHTHIRIFYIYLLNKLNFSFGFYISLWIEMLLLLMFLFLSRLYLFNYFCFFFLTSFGLAQLYRKRMTNVWIVCCAGTAQLCWSGVRANLPYCIMYFLSRFVAVVDEFSCFFLTFWRDRYIKKINRFEASFQGRSNAKRNAAWLASAESEYKKMKKKINKCRADWWSPLHIVTFVLYVMYAAV